MTKKEILDYVMNSPQNTNPSVLKGMLNSATDGGESGTGVFMVEVGPKEDSSNIMELKATWQEIYDAFNSGKIVAVFYSDNDEEDPSSTYNYINLVMTIVRNRIGCIVEVLKYVEGMMPVQKVTYTCSAPDERPHTGDNSGGNTPVS